MMKRFILFIAFFGYIIVNAQNFEGIVTYQISYPTITDKAALADMPTEMTLYIKGDKIRSDIEYYKHPDNPKVQPTLVFQSKVVDLATKSYFELLTVGKDNKYIIETSTKQIEEKLIKMPVPNLVVQDSTRMIKDYVCKIAVLTEKIIDPTSGQGIDYPLTIYYSEVFGNKNIYIDEDFRDIGGLMLEYTIYAKNIPIKFTAVKIKKKKIKDDEFERPTEGYQKDVDRDTVQHILNGGK